MCEPTMRPEAQRHLKRIDSADLVIGIPTFCNAKTVGMVVKTVLDGVTADLKDLRVVIVNADAGRSCGTQRAVADAAADATIPVVIGGYHATALPAEAAEHADIVVVGEAEGLWPQILAEIESGKAQQKIYRNKEFIEMRNMVIPRRELLDRDMYTGFATIQATRGCPYKCVFCTVHIVMGKKWRARSPKNVVDELEQLIQTYRIKQIDFYDENMTLDKKRMENICDLIVERKLDVDWYTPNGVRADTLDENLLRKMKKSGCKRIRVAPESGLQRVVDQIVKKDQKLTEVEKAIVLARKVGIKVGCFFVLGLIGETKKDIQATINYAYKLRKLGADKFYFSIATPIYGTELYEQAKQGGFLRDNFSYESLAATEPQIETPEFTADELLELCVQANLVNPLFTRDKLIKAIRDPKKAIKILLGK